MSGRRSECANPRPSAARPGREPGEVEMHENVKKWATLLDGREYRKEMTRAEEKEAKEDGVVIIFGASDDLCEFRGVVCDEVDCNDGGIVNRVPKIEAVWCDPESGSSWSYKTSIPHETFRILEDADLYCIGIVFDAEMRGRQG